MTGTKLVALGAVTAAMAEPAREMAPHVAWMHLDVGAPFNVLIAIAFGAFVGVWNRRIEHKGNLIGAFMASLVLTIGVVVGLPEWTGYTWKDTGYQAAMGMLLAFTSQNWGPALVEKVSERFFSSSRKSHVE